MLALLHITAVLYVSHSMSVLQKRKLHKRPLIALTYTNIHVTDGVTMTSLSASVQQKTSAATECLCKIALNRNYRENSKSGENFQVAIKGNRTKNRVKRDPRVYWRARSHSVCVRSVPCAHTVGQCSDRWVLLWRTSCVCSINWPHSCVFHIAVCFCFLAAILTPAASRRDSSNFSLIPVVLIILLCYTR